MKPCTSSRVPRRRSRCNFRVSLCAVVLTLAVFAGCQDPYSIRRIQRRVDHMASLAADINKTERLRSERLRKVGPTLREWMQRDVERSRERRRTAGDYIW